MRLSIPPTLRPGDKVAAVSPSWGGPGEVPHRYAYGKKCLEDTFGLTVVESPHALKSAAWLHQNPKARADDLMWAFSDPSIKAVIATIGGDDSVRLIPHMDLDVIRNNPKIFLGYSDTTVSHFMCFKAGLVSFYGPSVMSGFGESTGMFPYGEKAVRDLLFSPDAPGLIPPNSDGWTVERLEWADPAHLQVKRTLTPNTGPRLLQGSGCVRGNLLGGCIEVLEMIKGTSLWPTPEEWDGAILFIETSEDQLPPSYLLYCLRNYAATGLLHRLKGILLGRPGGARLPLAEHEAYDKALLTVLHEEGLHHLPVLANMDFGHTDPMMVLPMGAQAEIECSSASLYIPEAVTDDSFAR